MLLQQLVVSLEKIRAASIEGKPVVPTLVASIESAAVEYREITGNDPYQAGVNQWDAERELGEEYA